MVYRCRTLMSFSLIVLCATLEAACSGGGGQAAMPSVGSAQTTTAGSLRTAATLQSASPSGIKQVGNAVKAGSTGTTSVAFSGLSAAAGDIQVVYITVGESNGQPTTVTAPPNFTLVSSADSPGRQYGERLYVAKSALVANPVFTLSASHSDASYAVELAGVDAANPVDTGSAALVDNLVAETPVKSTAITPAVANDRLLAFFSIKSVGATVQTPPAGYTEISPTGPQGPGVETADGYYLDNPALAAQQPSLTWSAGAPAAGGAYVALRSASGSTTTPPPTSSPPPPGSLPSETPSQADAFVDSIGMNTHFDIQSAPWQNPTVFNLLVATGIRHVRDDSIKYNWNANGMTNYHGFYHNDGDPFITQMPQNDTAISFVEPDNEGDCSDGSNWVSLLRQFQPRLWNDVKGSSNYAAAPHAPVAVLGPSLCNMFNGAPQALGNLSVNLDYGNVHWSPPNATFPEDFSSSMGLTGVLALEANISGSKPVWITETGMNDNPANEQCYGGNYFADPVIMKYFPREFASNWNHHVPRTMIYEFADVPSEGCVGNQGLVNASASPKPQYNSVKAMISLLSDKGGSFNPAPISWSASGSTANLAHLTLEKRDGSVWLLLWLAVSSWRNHAVLNVPPQAITINLAKTPHGVTRYTYNADGTVSSSALTPSPAVPLNATDAITYLKISP